MSVPSPSEARPRRERGSATVHVAVLLVGLTVVALLGADLAALAAAEARASGSGAACVAAARVSDANQAVLRRCRVDGRDVVVEVTVPARTFLRSTWDVPGRARAGPVGSASLAR
jgi:hypothetical protein